MFTEDLMNGAIRVLPWPDPVLDAIGHDPRSWYVETLCDHHGSS